MRIAFASSDVQNLKQLSYKITAELNAYLDEEKRKRKVATKSLYNAVANLVSDQLQAHIKSLPKELQTLFPADGDVTEEAIYKIAVNGLPEKFGSTTIQVCLAKALGYDDWGDLQAKVIHGHSQVKSQADLLHNRTNQRQISIKLIESLVKIFPTAKDEFEIPLVHFNQSLGEFIVDIFPMGDISAAIPTDANILVKGLNSEASRLWMNRFSVVGAKGHIIRTFCKSGVASSFLQSEELKNIEPKDLHRTIFGLIGEQSGGWENKDRTIESECHVGLYGFTGKEIEEISAIFSMTRSFKMTFLIVLDDSESLGDIEQLLKGQDFYNADKK